MTNPLNLHEAARLLGMPDRVVRRWVRQGTIPSGMQNGKPVFDEESLRNWAKEHNLVLSVPSAHDGPAKARSTHICDAMRHGGVCYGIRGADPESVLRTLLDRVLLPEGVDKTALLAKLIERENLASTGMGRGVAIPHPRSPIEGLPPDPIIATGFLDAPVDYNSIDGQPVFVLFLMLSPSPKIHLQLLSRLGYCLREDDFVSFLQSRPDADSLFERVREMEDGLDAKKRV